MCLWKTLDLESASVLEGPEIRLATSHMILASHHSISCERAHSRRHKSILQMLAIARILSRIAVIQALGMSLAQLFEASPQA